jgi:RNA polymerase sigma-70 factor, ECF subfamily
LENKETANSKIMTEAELQQFEQHRPVLFAIAYRMLGSVADAEDIVQDTYLFWQKADRNTVPNPGGWLSTVVTRLSINQLKSARSRREEYVGPWLPEPLVCPPHASPEENAKLAESLSIAFLVVLERLSPTERAVLLLREVFGYEFREIAPIVEKSETNCRQILGRARRRLCQERPHFYNTGEQSEAVLQKFLHSITTGDVAGLLSVLAPGVTATTDGGGKARAVLRPIVGADRVVRFVLGALKKFVPQQREYRDATINGQPGVIGYDSSCAVQVLTFAISGGHIEAIYIINNPEKLKHISGLTG